MARSVNRALWDQWQQRLERQRTSGLSVVEFCRREHVSSPASLRGSGSFSLRPQHGTHQARPLGRNVFGRDTSPSPHVHGLGERSPLP